MSQRFPLGKTVITRTALASLDAESIARSLARHTACDWGELCEEDRQENERSLMHGFRLMSVYQDSNGIKFWIITEADRSATTVLLPEDY